jgi:hypothetical protein
MVHGGCGLGPYPFGVDLISVEDYGSDGDSLFGHEGGGGWRPRATDLLERGHDGTEAHWWSPMVVGERERGEDDNAVWGLIED